MNRNLIVISLFCMITLQVQAQNFKTVKLGNQVWMAENLNVNVPGSWVYNNKQEFGDKYGRLYSWEAAVKACPQGWHLPGDKEWQILIDYLGGEDKAGKQMKTGGASGFNALLGGLTDVSGYRLMNMYGTFWSSSSYDQAHAWYVYVTQTSNVINMTYFQKNYGFSVRYIKN